MIDEQFQNGLIALADSRYQDAIAAFENTLKLDPENKLAHLIYRGQRTRRNLLKRRLLMTTPLILMLLIHLLFLEKHFMIQGNMKNQKTAGSRYSSCSPQTGLPMSICSSVSLN
jgi:tetratricopeptide (TPR) repeat protein